MAKPKKKRGPGRPALPPSEKRVVITVRLPPDTVAELDAIAEADGETRTATVEQLVEDETERRRNRR